MAFSINVVRNVCRPVASMFYQTETMTRKLCSQDMQSELKPTKKKTIAIPRITLISGSSLTITTLEDAQKISKRRDLKLVKIIDLDSKTQRPVYKLMTGAEYHEEDLKQREDRKKQKSKSFIKGSKLLLLNNGISEHDLEVQAKKVLKWLQKSYQVDVVISNNTSNMEKSENIFNAMEKFIKSEGRLLQKRIKNSELKFQVIPPKKENDDL